MTNAAVLALGLLAMAAPLQAAPPAEYRVAAGDVLEITVAGRPELARLPTVQTTGAIWLPRLSDVGVAGLTTAEISRKLTSLLGRVEPARPEVSVAVKEYRSQFVWADGEVNHPGRQPFKEGLRLMDLLLQVGGFTARASGEVLVQRREGAFPDGSQARRFRFPRSGPSLDALEALQTVLHRDDVVTASLTSYVTVTGAVVRPGRYPLDPDGTLTTAVSSAGGVAAGSGRRRASVNRRDPSSGQVKTLQVDLEAVETGRESDLVLLPDDQIEIKARL